MTIMGFSPRRLYQASTSSTARSVGMPGSPSGSAEFARPVNPLAARSSQPPRCACSVACQCRADIRSNAEIHGSIPVIILARPFGPA